MLEPSPHAGQQLPGGLRKVLGSRVRPPRPPCRFRGASAAAAGHSLRGSGRRAGAPLGSPTAARGVPRSAHGGAGDAHGEAGGRGCTSRGDTRDPRAG